MTGLTTATPSIGITQTRNKIKTYARKMVCGALLVIIFSPCFAFINTQNIVNAHTAVEKTVQPLPQAIASPPRKYFTNKLPYLTAQTNAHTLSVSSIQQRLVDFIHNMINTLRYSAYKLGGTHFDLRKGVYIVDCSSYVDYILQKIYPHAYSSLVNWSASLKPTTHDYYQFFNTLYDDPQTYWSIIQDVEELLPGDIIVFRYRNPKNNEHLGHIMIVMDKPIRHKGAYMVRIADSAPARHSRDTRQARVSGIGIGTVLLKIDPKTYQPSAYAWKIGSRWKHNVNFAMARPIDMLA